MISEIELLLGLWLDALLLGHNEVLVLWVNFGNGIRSLAVMKVYDATCMKRFQIVA